MVGRAWRWGSGLALIAFVGFVLGLWQTVPVRGAPTPGPAAHQDPAGGATVWLSKTAYGPGFDPSHYAPGHLVTYEIRVEVRGEVNPPFLTGARVTDDLSPLTSTSWRCASLGNAECSPFRGTGNVDVNLDFTQEVGDVLIIATGTVPSTFDDHLINTAHVQAPEGSTFLCASGTQVSETECSATSNTLTPTAPPPPEFGISKSAEGPTFNTSHYIPGEPVMYVINISGGNAAGARLTDDLSPLTDINWFCGGFGAQCSQEHGTGNIDVNLTFTSLNGGAVIEVTGTVPAKFTEDLVNTAHIQAPVPVTCSFGEQVSDTECSATSNTLVFLAPGTAIVSISKSAVGPESSLSHYVPGGQVTYFIPVYSATTLAEARVTDDLSPLTNGSWTCESFGADCSLPQGTGNVDVNVDFPDPGGGVLIEVTGTVPSGFNGDLVNTAHIQSPAGTTLICSAGMQVSNTRCSATSNTLTLETPVTPSPSPSSSPSPAPSPAPKPVPTATVFPSHPGLPKTGARAAD